MSTNFLNDPCIIIVTGVQVITALSVVLENSHSHEQLAG